MLLHSAPLFSIYCGDKKESFPRHHFYTVRDSDSLLKADQFMTAYKLMDLEYLIAIKQIHSNKGYCITSPKQLETFRPYDYEGDFLITNLSHVGLAISSADCLPLIAYDSAHNCIGIAHAGWSGSVQGIAEKMLDAFQENFDTKLEDVHMYFGPSAKSCCYEVKEDMIARVNEFSYGTLALAYRDGKTYFDVPKFNQLQLEAYGIGKRSFHHRYNLCTICNPSFCSYRREREESERQMTIVALK